MISIVYKKKKPDPKFFISIKSKTDHDKITTHMSYYDFHVQNELLVVFNRIP